MRRATLLIAAALLFGCGRSTPQAGTMQKLNTFDVAPEPAGREAAAPGPQIAYSYATEYVLAVDRIAAVQSRQVALCRSLSTNRCLVMKTSVSGDADHDAGSSGATTLLVDAHLAAAFSQRLDRLAGDGGGSVATHSVDAEDVTKQVIDIDARVGAKQALAGRLMQIIQTTNGNVAQLVEAEKAYADTQEELEAARGEQAALRQRVAMSRFELTYQSRSSVGALAPVRRSLGNAGETLAGSIAALIWFVVAALPWVLLLSGVLWIARKRGWRLRRRRLAEPAE